MSQDYMIRLDRIKGLGPSHFRAIGEFIVSCSAMEGAMHSVLRSALGIADETARCLIREPRHDDLVDLIKSALAMRYFTEVTIDAIVTLLETSKKLNRIRSVVAHKSSFAYERDLLFNNAATAKVSRAIYYYVCTAKQLRTAAALGREVAELLSKFPYTAPNTDVIKLLAELESKYLSADLPRDPREIQREIQSSAATDQKTKPVAHHKSRVLQPSEKIPLTLLRSLKMRRIPD